MIADLAPFGQELRKTLLWMWLGVATTPYTSRLRPMALAPPERADDPPASFHANVVGRIRRRARVPYNISLAEVQNRFLGSTAQ